MMVAWFITIYQQFMSMPFARGAGGSGVKCAKGRDGAGNLSPMPMPAEIPAVIMPDLLDFKGVVLQSISNKFSRTCAAPG
jgi:hypothetical protein